MLLTVLNIVLLVGLVAFLLTIFIFMKNLRPKVPDFASYIKPSGLLIIFIGLIDKFNYWGLCLLSQINYTWGAIRESINHNFPKFVSPLPPVTPLQTKTFKTSHPSSTNLFTFYLCFPILFFKILFYWPQLYPHPLLSTQMLGLWIIWKAWLWRYFK